MILIAIIGRTYALLDAFTPPSLRPLLPGSAPSSSEDRTVFLRALSSGQLLCETYNAAVRRSRKPWGFVAKATIHDLQALEAAAAAGKVEAEAKEEGQRGWTFRRVDNLRIWAAALKLRYSIPIVTPHTNSSKSGGGGTSSGNTPNPTPPASASLKAPQSFRTPEPPILFDALCVARRDEGWEDMLEGVVRKWVERVVGEERGER